MKRQLTKTMKKLHPGVKEVHFAPGFAENLSDADRRNISKALGKGKFSKPERVDMGQLRRDEPEVYQAVMRGLRWAREQERKRKT